MVHVFLQSNWTKNSFEDTPAEEIIYRTLEQSIGLSRHMIIHDRCDFLKGDINPERFFPLLYKIYPNKINKRQPTNHPEGLNRWPLPMWWLWLLLFYLLYLPSGRDGLGSEGVWCGGRLSLQTYE